MKKVGLLKVCIPFSKMSLMEWKICSVMLISIASALLSTSSKCVDRPACQCCVARKSGRETVECKGQRIDRYRVSSPRGVGAVSASREFITPAIRLAKSPALQSIDLLNPTSR